METTTIVVFLGTFFTLFILALAGILLMRAQGRRIRADLKLQEAEITKQKEILEMAMKTQEEERKRVGIELHDDLGPTFSAINLRLNNILRKVELYDDDKLNQMIKDVQNDTVESIQKFSNVSRLLYPVTLHRQGIKHALTDFVGMLNKSADAQISLDMDFEPDFISDFTIALFRICQELCNNGVKHSTGNNISLSIATKNNNLNIDYEDDGSGIDFNEITKGIGLESIQSRVMAFGGTQKIENKIPTGLHIQIVFNHDKVSHS